MVVGKGPNTVGQYHPRPICLRPRRLVVGSIQTPSAPALIRLLSTLQASRRIRSHAQIGILNTGETRRRPALGSCLYHVSRHHPSIARARVRRYAEG